MTPEDIKIWVWFFIMVNSIMLVGAVGCLGLFIAYVYQGSDLQRWVKRKRKA